MGRGTSANTPPQTAKNGPQPPSPADNRPDLSYDQQELNKAVAEMVDESYLSDRIKNISEGFYSRFLLTCGAEEARISDPKRTYTITEYHLDYMYETLRTIYHLSNIYERFEQLREINRKEVGHE